MAHEKAGPNCLNSESSIADATLLSNRMIKVGLLNARSVKNKFVDICESLESKNISLCGVTETWLHDGDEVVKKEFYDMGYNLHHKARKFRRGGGVGFLAKRGIKSQELNPPSFESFELSEVLVTCQKDKFLFSTFYRTGILDTSTKEQFLIDIEQYATPLVHKSYHVVLWGDFNIHIENKDDSFANEFIELMLLLGFKQMIEFPTHIAGGTLDLIFVCDESIIDSLKVYTEQNDCTLYDYLILDDE